MLSVFFWQSFCNFYDLAGGEALSIIARWLLWAVWTGLRWWACYFLIISAQVGINSLTSDGIVLYFTLFIPSIAQFWSLLWFSEGNEIRSGFQENPVIFKLEIHKRVIFQFWVLLHKTMALYINKPFEVNLLNWIKSSSWLARKRQTVKCSSASKYDLNPNQITTGNQSSWNFTI